MDKFVYHWVNYINRFSGIYIFIYIYTYICVYSMVWFVVNTIILLFLKCGSTSYPIWSFCGTRPSYNFGTWDRLSRRGTINRILEQQYFATPSQHIFLVGQPGYIVPLKSTLSQGQIETTTMDCVFFLSITKPPLVLEVPNWCTRKDKWNMGLLTDTWTPFFKI